MTAVASETSCPLCVDMDGTLIASDTVWESVLLMIRNKPGPAMLMPLWLLRGRAYLKRRMAEHVTPDPALLPYRAEVIDFLKKQKEAGRRIMLVTASDEQVAKSVAEHVGLFDEVIGSRDGMNCRAEQKLQTIRKRFGDSFDYIGDSRADLPVWEAAREAYLVSPSGRLLALAKQRCQPRDIFASSVGGRWRAMIRALRPVQWVKNLLVLLPLVLAHKASDRFRVNEAILAFIAFCFCASGVYVMNDLLDIEHDRHHPQKRNRPFASGALPVPFGLAMNLALLLAAFAIALAVSPRFAAVLLLYFVCTSAYSLFFKGRLLMDVIVLAGLYTLRLMGGAVAVTVPLSEWLLAFSMFFFISLAFVKRYSQLIMLQSANEQFTRGRGYLVQDLEIIQSVGPTSGYLAVLVFCQYISSDLARSLYKRPQFLWLIAPVLLYWITRTWVLARRRVLTDDPVVFAMKDKMSWLAGAITLLLALVATL